MKCFIAPAEAANERKKPSYVGLQVDGAGGGQWELSLGNGRLIAIDQGITERCTATFHLNSHTFAQLASDQTTAQQAVENGDIRIKGNGLPQSALIQVLEEAASGGHRVHAR